MKAGRRVALWNRVLLAAELHRRHQAGKHVLGVFQRIGLHESVQRLQQGSHNGRGPGVEQKSQVYRGRTQAGFAEQPLVQRAGVERDPFDAYAIALDPLGRGVPTLAAGEHRHMHAVRQDDELFRLGLGPDSRRKGSGNGAHCLNESAAIQHGVSL